MARYSITASKPTGNITSEGRPQLSFCHDRAADPISAVRTAQWYVNLGYTVVTKKVG